MPTYQYRCSECGSETEAVQKFTDPALTECPSCAGALKKVYGNVGVVFKGSGFYATDSRNNGSKQKAKTGSDAKADSSSTTSGSGSGEAASTSDAAPAASSSSGTSSSATSTSSGSSESAA